MRFRAQSLTRPFRVYAILPVDRGSIPIPLGSRPLSSAYEIMPGGDRFIKDVALDFVIDAARFPAQDVASIGIAQLSADHTEWKWLPSGPTTPDLNQTEILGVDFGRNRLVQQRNTHDATRAGMILGTAAYMSPEQARGSPVDKRPTFGPSAWCSTIC